MPPELYAHTMARSPAGDRDMANAANRFTATLNPAPAAAQNDRTSPIQSLRLLDVMVACAFQERGPLHSRHCAWFDSISCGSLSCEPCLVNPTRLVLALALHAPARATTPGNCPDVALGDLVPPLLLRCRPDLRFSAILAGERHVCVEAPLNEVGDAVAVRRAQEARIDQGLAFRKLCPSGRFHAGARKTFLRRLLRALRRSALQNSGSAWAIASHGTWRCYGRSPRRTRGCSFFIDSRNCIRSRLERR